jgi:hypothetical protein
VADQHRPELEQRVAAPELAHAVKRGVRKSEEAREGLGCVL